MIFLRKSLLALIVAVLLTLAPASVASAAVDTRVDLQYRNMTAISGSLAAYVGSRPTIDTVVTANPGENAAQTVVVVAIPAEMRSIKVTAPAGTACSRTQSSLSCTVGSITVGAPATVSYSGVVYRTGNPTITATATTPGDQVTANDGASSPLNVLRQLRGRKCTVLGTSGRDTIVGTSGDDTICGLAGNDRISGAGGNDLIYGDAGRDRINGSAGNDGVQGGAGNDRLFGDAGSDSLVGGKGSDTLVGGADQDTFFGNAGNDVIRACDGNAEYILADSGGDHAFVDASDQVFDVEKRSRC